MGSAGFKKVILILLQSVIADTITIKIIMSMFDGSLTGVLEKN